MTIGRSTSACAVLLLFTTMLLGSNVAFAQRFHPSWAAWNAVFSPGGVKNFYYNPEGQPDWVAGDTTVDPEIRIQMMEDFIRAAVDEINGIEGTSLRLAYRGRTTAPCHPFAPTDTYVICWTDEDLATWGADGSISAYSLESPQPDPRGWNVSTQRGSVRISKLRIDAPEAVPYYGIRRSDDPVGVLLLRGIMNTFGFGRQELEPTVMSRWDSSGPPYLTARDRRLFQYAHPAFDEACALRLAPGGGTYSMDIPQVWVNGYPYSATLQYGADGQFHVAALERKQEIQIACSLYFDAETGTLDIPYVLFRFPSAPAEAAYDLKLRFAGNLAFTFEYVPAD